MSSDEAAHPPLPFPGKHGYDCFKIEPSFHEKLALRKNLSVLDQMKGSGVKTLNEVGNISALMGSFKEVMLHDTCGSPGQEIKKIFTVDIINRSIFSAGVILLVAVQSWLSPWPVSLCWRSRAQARRMDLIV